MDNFLFFPFCHVKCIFDEMREDSPNPATGWLEGMQPGSLLGDVPMSVEAALADSLSISFHVNLLEQVSAVDSDVGPRFQHSTRHGQHPCSKGRLTH